MIRTKAKCQDCGTAFEADELMLEADSALAAAQLFLGVARAGVFCPKCTSPEVVKA